MRKLLFTMCALIYSSCCAAGSIAETIDLAFAELRFAIPAPPLVIASSGGEANILIFRYGHDKGGKYLALTDMSQEASLNYGCKPEDFFRDAFTSNSASTCNKGQLQAFSEIFLSEVDKGSWIGDQMTVYFSMGKEQSFLFACAADRKVVKIDTDFLNKDELRNVVSAYIK